MSPARRVVSWRKSDAKKILAKDIKEGVVTLGLDATQVYQMHDGIFLAYEFKNFKANLKTLLLGNTTNLKLAEFDHAALELHPEAADSSSNIPKWNGSDAQRLLKEDVRTGLNNTLSPMELYRSREEYQTFPLDKFRYHIYQEVRSLKKSAFWETTAKKKTYM